MPTLSFSNLGDVMSREILVGTIQTIDPETDTCTVTVNGSVVSALLFYHCRQDSVLRDNGAIQGAASGFLEDDQVVVIRSKADDTAPVYVVGHVDGIRACRAWELAFTFPGDVNLVDDYYVSLLVALKIKISGTYVMHYAEVKIPFSTTTFPIRTGNDGKISQYYIQVDNISGHKIDADNRTFSFSLSVWDNHGELGESHTGEPTVVVDAKFVCSYSWNHPEDMADFIPLPGVIVTEEFANWHLFANGEWNRIVNRYNVDVTMYKRTGDGQVSITAEYLNNNTGSGNYSASGHSDFSEFIINVEDDYDYSGPLRNYINLIAMSITADSQGYTIFAQQSIYDYMGYPSVEKNTSERIPPSGVTSSWQDQHPYLSYSNPYPEDEDPPNPGKPPTWYYERDNSGEISFGVEPYSVEHISAGGYTFTEIFEDHTTWRMKPHGYESTKGSRYFTFEDGSFSNVLSIGNPSIFVSTQTLGYYAVSFSGISELGIPAGVASYTISGTKRSHVTWTYTKSIYNYPTQLPAINARISHCEHSAPEWQPYISPMQAGFTSSVGG